MANVTSGDTISITIQHPVVGAKELYAQSDQDVVLMPAGYSNEYTPTGGPLNVVKKTKHLAKLTGLQIANADGVLGFLNDVRNQFQSATITWEHIDGTIKTGEGQITTSELGANTNTGFIELEFTFDRGYRDIS